MTRNGQGPVLLAQLFAEAGNALHPTPRDIRSGHEPVHRSESGTCVSIDPALPAQWYCHSWNKGGRDVEALMSLRGLSREQAEAELHARNGHPGGGEERRGRDSQATQLVALALAAAELFHDPGQETYAGLTVGTHREVWPTGSTGFRRWLLWRFYQAHQKAPTPEAVKTAIQTLGAKAQFEGICRPVYLRVAPDEQGGLFIDLGDATWRAIHVTPGRWDIVNDVPVMFRRSPGMLPSPEPVRGGTLDQLRPLVNVPDDGGWALVKAWLVAAMTPRGPYPPLALRGEQGSAKSTLAKMLRAVIDPATPELRSDPRELRDLAIAARACWIVGFDNVGHIQPWLSDALCRLATGGGWATRELYTDMDEVLFEARRPVILNGITEFVAAQDLLDRIIQLDLPPIPKHARTGDRPSAHHPDTADR